jgi:ABC-type transport system involved in cytochrome bd biosynthesis fused ATPase/permease subunit
MPEVQPVAVQPRIAQGEIEIPQPVASEAPEPSHKPWALLNVLLAILAAVLTGLFTVKFFVDRLTKKDDSYEEKPIDQAQWVAMTPEQRVALMVRREKERQAAHEAQREKEEKERREKSLYVNAPALLVVALAFVESLIILFTTQDFSGKMAFADSWSIAMAAVVAVQVATPMIAAALKNKWDKNADPTHNRALA